MSAIVSASMNDCPYCRGTLWVCEDHPDQPWRGHKDDTGCAGAGMPCLLCVETVDPNNPPDISGLGLVPEVVSPLLKRRH